MHVPGYTARSQPNYDKFPQRAFGKTNPVKRSFQDSLFTNRTSLHYDEANDPTFCRVGLNIFYFTTFTLHKYVHVNIIKIKGLERKQNCLYGSSPSRVAYKDGKMNSNNLDKAFIINGFSN